MRIRYVIPIDEAKKLIIPDHWAFPMLGGVCLIREEGGLAKTIEVIFNGQKMVKNGVRFILPWRQTNLTPLSKII